MWPAIEATAVKVGTAPNFVVAKATRANGLTSHVRVETLHECRRFLLEKIYRSVEKV